MWLESGVADGRRISIATRLRDAAADQLGIGGLAEDNLRIWTLPTQDPGDACDCATGAIASDPIVQPLTGEISQNFARGGILVHLGVVGGFKLVGQEPAIGVGQ